MAFSVLAVAQLVSPARVSDPLTLADLDRAHDTVMSCADGDGASDEPMWCADPSSPHCIPASPASPAPDLADHSAPATLQSGQTSLLAYVVIGWPQPLAQAAPILADRARLERPPRI